MQRLVHELEVHQIELEMQNDELRQTQQQLETSRNRYASLFDFAPIGYVTFNEDGLILEANLAAATLLGVHRAALIHHKLCRFITPGSQDDWYLHRQQVYRTGIKQSVELQLQQPNALPFHAHLESMVAADEHQGRKLCRTTLCDISQRKRMELEIRTLNAKLEHRVIERSEQLKVANEQLLDNRRRYQAIFNATFQFIGLLQPDGTLIEANQTALDFAGLTPDDVIGKPFWECHWWTISSETQVELYNAVTRAAKGEFIRYTVDVLGAREKILTIDFSLKPVKDQQGNVILIIPEGRDISDYKRLEREARKHQEELAHVLRLGTMGELATGLAHELSQPLAAISNYSETTLILLHAEGTPIRKTIELQQKIASLAKRAGKIIRHLRTLVDKQRTHRTAADLNRLVKDVVRLTNVEASEYAVNIDLDLEEHLPQVYVDDIQIEQVLLNLVRNGYEAMRSADSKQRKLAIHTRLQSDGMLKCSVEDVGPGLNSKQASGIFETFYTTKDRGMGMGLPISRSIIETHGGHLWVESEPGKGATFCFTLPAAER